MSKAEATAKKPEGFKKLTESEAEELFRDVLPPEEYANTTLHDKPAEEAKETPAAPTSEVPASETPDETPASEERPSAETPASTPTPIISEDSFEKLERELAKPEGKEDLSKFTPREKAYYHQMRRDRKARQRAEEERDVALRNLQKTQNPPPPPPDPFVGKAEDDVLSVKEVRDLLAKQPKPETPSTPAAQAISPQQKRYLNLCEKEARDAHPDDFDAVMELADELIAGDAIALREIGQNVAEGANPAEEMYKAVKRHKDFETLLPAAQTRVKARQANAAPAAPAATPPASPSAPAATPTPEDKAKIDKAKQAEKALENNATRTRTTAHVSTREGKPASELTIEEIGEMSDLEFAKLPKNVRQAYLKKHASYGFFTPKD